MSNMIVADYFKVTVRFVIENTMRIEVVLMDLLQRE